MQIAGMQTPFVYVTSVRIGAAASVLVNRDGQEVKLIRGPVHAPEVSKLIKLLL